MVNAYTRNFKLPSFDVLGIAAPRSHRLPLSQREEMHRADSPSGYYDPQDDRANVSGPVETEAVVPPSLLPLDPVDPEGPLELSNPPEDANWQREREPISTVAGNVVGHGSLQDAPQVKVSEVSEQSLGSSSCSTAQKPSSTGWIADVLPLLGTLRERSISILWLR
jgi:hypothetical protein